MHSSPNSTYIAALLSRPAAGARTPLVHRLSCELLQPWTESPSQLSVAANIKATLATRDRVFRLFMGIGKYDIFHGIQGYFSHFKSGGHLAIKFNMHFFIGFWSVFSY